MSGVVSVASYRSRWLSIG